MPTTTAVPELTPSQVSKQAIFPGKRKERVNVFILSNLSRVGKSGQVGHRPTDRPGGHVPHCSTEFPQGMFSLSSGKEKAAYLKCKSWLMVTYCQQ